MYLVCLAVYGINIYKMKKWIELTTAIYIKEGKEIIRPKILHRLYSISVMMILVLLFLALVYPIFTYIILVFNVLLFVLIDLYFKNILVVLDDGFIIYGIQFDFSQIRSIERYAKGVIITNLEGEAHHLVVHSKLAIVALLHYK